MFDYNPQTPQYGFNQSGQQGQPSAINPFIASNSAFGGNGFNSDMFDDSMGPDWHKGRNNWHGWGGRQSSASVNNNPMGPLASANFNLFWGNTQTNTNPFIFY